MFQTKLLLLVCYILVCNSFNTFHRPPIRYNDLKIFAKKKGKALVSDEFLSTLMDDEIDDSQDKTIESTNADIDNDALSKKKKKKDKKEKKNKLAIDLSDDLINSLDESENSSSVHLSEEDQSFPTSDNNKDSIMNNGDINKSSSKKKGKKLAIDLADSFLDNLDNDNDDINSNTDINNIETNDSISIDTNITEDVEEDDGAKKKKKKKKKRSKKKEFDWNSSLEDSQGEEATEAPAEIELTKTSESISEEKILNINVDDDTQEVEMQEKVSVTIDSDETEETRMRKAKPPSRVRFAESSQPDYVMMKLEHVGLVYGNTVVLEDASFQVETGERVGLVGPNGGGKTSMLRILAQDLEPTTGDVVKSSKNLQVAFLRQEFTDEMKMDNTLKEELLSAFKEEQKILDEISKVEDEISRTTDDPDRMETVLNRLAELQDEAVSRGAYSLENKVEKIMDTMGFAEADAELRIDSFSGGWKMRIGIAKILLLSPSVILLDEPTNHLDLDSVFWLEGFLREQSIPMVIVSHDREFLDQVCNKIVDVEEGVTQSYEGNYSKFIMEKQNRLAIWKDQYDKQQKYIKEEEKWIKKNKANEQMAQAVSDRKRVLEKLIEGEDYVARPPKEKKFRFRFPPSPRCGHSVVEADGLGHGYGSGKYETLFKNVALQVDRGNRVGFVGPNGSGKSTMMRLIMGNEKPRDGWAEYGSANVVPVYFQQNQADAFDLDRTVLETVMEEAPSEITLTEIRALLGQFMFKNDDVDKKLRVLSGGEKARVALCRMMLTPANLLCLDEPTNHLDITAKEVLEDALQHYEGSVLCISHDRYFMSQIANTIFHFDNKTVQRYDCDYHDFMMATEELQEKVESRYVYGDKYRITNAKEVVVPKEKKKTNFGGSGVTGGNLYKGIKNAKRYAK